MELSGLPELVVLNKIDCASDDTLLPLQNELRGVPVSAIKRRGIGELLGAIDARLVAGS
jgi:50S ribosomal subunit-associated GTPase HflX